MYPIATDLLTLGPNVPLVMMPISSPEDENIFVPSLAIILPEGLIPTLIFETPFCKSFFILSQPLKPPSSLLLLEIAHFKFA